MSLFLREIAVADGGFRAEAVIMLNGHESLEVNMFYLLGAEAVLLDNRVVR